MLCKFCSWELIYRGLVPIIMVILRLHRVLSPFRGLADWGLLLLEAEEGCWDRFSLGDFLQGWLHLGFQDWPGFLHFKVSLLRGYLGYLQEARIWVVWGK